MRKISVITLGCSKNTVDSERLINQLQLNDYQIAHNLEEADIIFINTCGFIQAAKEESIETILETAELKKKGKVKKIFVGGCLSERYRKELIAEIPEVDAFFGVEDYKNIIKELKGNYYEEFLYKRTLIEANHYSYLKISEGCDRPCSFCAIPLMRGNHRSKTIEDLTKEAQNLAQSGVKELILIGQDTTYYGIDIYGKRKLRELIQRLSDIEEIKWIRLLYAYPSGFPIDIIEEMKANSKFLKYIDIPLQHISDKVLRSMKRGISSEQIKNLLNKLRAEIDDIAIRTTFIVGYPEEDEKDFEELMNFIEEFKFDRVGCFEYSPEEGTSAYKLGDPISHEEKKRRMDELMEVQQEISYQKNLNLIGKEFEILVDRTEGDFYIARSYRDAPEVDGEILLPKKYGTLKIGNFYKCIAEDCDEFDLYAKPLTES
jgi:ribosomal protein S12 methylthiotransferase